jgi:hypothetical protein
LIYINKSAQAQLRTLISWDSWVSHKKYQKLY